MKKTLAIIKHEFQGMIKRKSFIITTVLIPLLGLLAIVIPIIVQRFSGTETEVEIPSIGYVDRVGIFSEATDQPERSSSPMTAKQGENRPHQRRCRGILHHSDDYIATGVLERYSMKTELEPGTGSSTAIKDF